MTTIITRLYAANEHAANAVKALRRNGFGADEINLVSATSGRDANAANIEELIVNGGVRRSDVAAYADAVRKGNSLVTVRAPFGYAVSAIETLDSFGPVDAGIPPSDHYVIPSWHEAAPFSAFLGLEVLSKSKSSTDLLTKPAPLSASIGLPLLSKSKSSTGLLDNAAPLSSLLGLATLSQAKPFSSLSKSDKSSASLFKSATPFSDFFHLPVLMKDRSKRT